MMMAMLQKLKALYLMDRALSLIIICFVLIPISDLILPLDLQFADQVRVLFIFAIMGLGLNIVIGYAGLLNLGASAFVAVGAYTYAIASCNIYPFQLGFWLSCLLSLCVGAGAGVALGLPVLRLRGDYLAIVTLGFGEIIQDALRNLESISKGSQGINPLPPPTLFSYKFAPDNYIPWYYLFLGILVLLVVANKNLEHSRFGRNLKSIREDELAAQCTGISVAKMKLLAFALGSALCALSGALWVSFLGTSGEPGTYDFQLSIIALCIVVVGGLGSIRGVLLGAVVMLGFNAIVLSKFSSFLAKHGLASSANVFSSPTNWKYLVFGLVLILMIRFRPQGLLPALEEKT